MPVAIYGDEAKYSDATGDKFIALCLQSPLVQKQGLWTNTVFAVALFQTFWGDSSAHPLNKFLNFQARLGKQTFSSL